MSDDLLKRAEREAAFYDKKPTMFTTGTLLRDLAARVRELEAERDEDESTIASLADTIASAHRNTEMHGEGVNKDLRGAVWELSYRANEYRSERDTLRAENERLRGLLRELVDALREEARTTLAANVATENFTTPDREIDAMSLAMVRALAAMKAAKDALAAGEKT